MLRFDLAARAADASSFPWLDTFQTAGAIASVVAAVAALVAVQQAAKTVHETRAMRKEERLNDLLELVHDIASDLHNVVYNVAYGPERLAVTELRLQAAIDASGEDLPACRALIGAGLSHTDPFTKVMEIVTPAFLEVGALLAQKAASRSDRTL